MSRMNLRWILLVAPLLLWGCLLPQPDTPIIPPPGATIGQDNRAMMPDPRATSTVPQAPESAAGTASDATATGLVSGKVEGENVTAVTAVPLGAMGKHVRQDVDDAGIFDLPLTPGEYQLELTVNGRAVMAAQVLTVKADETRTFIVTVTQNPTAATVTETTPPTESPAATPETSASP